MGLFEFVFGKSAPKDDTEPKQAYYLSDDDAKTFGNIEYMRSTKVVRRTFAKRKGETEHMESIRQISATDAKSLDNNVGSSFNNGYSQPAPTFAAYAAPATPVAPAPVAQPAAVSSSAPVSTSEPVAPESPTPTPEVSNAPTPRRKPASSDMDMFRNMAKDIRR